MVYDEIQLLIVSVNCFLLILLFVQTLSLRQNLIKKIENLESLSSLQELDLYDNQIRKLENLQTLTEIE